MANLDTFGAQGDSSDDTDRFRAAIQSLGSVGGTVRIRTSGTYLISSPLVIDGRLSISIECGGGISRAAADVQTINIVYTGATGSLLTAHGIRGLEISHCNLAYSNPTYNGNLIDLDRANAPTDTKHIYLHDNRLGGLSTTRGGAASLIYLHLSEDVVIERNMFMNGRVGILGPSDTYINANRIAIRNNWFNGPFSDVAIRAGGAAWEISGNIFEPINPAKTCGAFDTTAAGVMALSFTGNWIGDGSRGTCIAATAGPIGGGIIAGNLITGGTVGISLGHSDGVTITGNRFGLVSPAIDTGTSSDINISANSFGSIPIQNRVVGAAAALAAKPPQP